MYRDSNEFPERDHGDRANLSGNARRRLAPVPLGLFSGFLGLAAEFFGLFLLAWGMAPTSIGCGAGRAASMIGVQLAIAVGIFGAISAVGLGIMSDAQESQVRRRSYLLTSGAIYLLGSIPLLAAAALFGSCFDF